MAVGKEANMSNAMKSAGHGVLQEATDELVGGECHHLGFAVLTIVLPGEADLAIVEPNKTTVGDGDTMGVAPKITEYLLGSGERRLGEDDPVDLGQRVDTRDEVCGNSQGVEGAGESEFTIREGGMQPLQEQFTEAVREGTDRQEEAWWAGDPSGPVGRDAATGNDAVQVWMVTPTPTIP